MVRLLHGEGNTPAWLVNVEKHGELRKHSGASWDLEMSSMTDMLIKQKKQNPPAVLFDDIPGSPKGFRALFAPTSSTWRLKSRRQISSPSTG